MSEKIDLSDPYFLDYKDRGIQKWNGFYLSEHTAAVEQTKKEERSIVAQKRKMSEGEIGQLLEFAFNNQRQLRIQIEMRDTEGNYFPDTTGIIEGFDGLGLTVDNTKVHYDEIRNVELCSLVKWSDVQDLLN